MLRLIIKISHLHVIICHICYDAIEVKDRREVQISTPDVKPLRVKLVYKDLVNVSYKANREAFGGESQNSVVDLKHEFDSPIFISVNF